MSPPVLTVNACVSFLRKLHGFMQLFLLSRYRQRGNTGKEVSSTETQIIRLAQIIGAVTVILSAVLGGYRLYDKLVELERRVTSLEKENHGIKKENALVIYALGACLDGLHQQGCNGKVTEAMEKIGKYINQAAHDQED